MKVRMMMVRKLFCVVLIGLLSACSSLSEERPQSAENMTDNKNDRGAGKAEAPLSISKTTNRMASHSDTTLDKNICNELDFKLLREHDANLIYVTRSETTVETIKLPTGLVVNGFSVNFVKKTKNGFQFSVEYGSRYYYEKTFYFNCRDGKFFLTQLRVQSHDQANPEKTSKNSLVKIRPAVKLERFDISNYMKEF
jgi:hypothetical protein